MVNQIMEIMDTRLVEIKGLVKSWINKKRANKKELQSLNGKLMFVSKCIHGSHIFLSSLLCTLQTLKKQKHRFRLSEEFKKDLRWWDEFQEVSNGVSIIPDMKWSNPDEVMSTDACLKGTGGWCGSEYFSMRFPSHLEGCHINFLELITILVDIRL